jgi:hypothetical protein
VHYEGEACTVGLDACEHWVERSAENAGDYACKWGPYTVALDDCQPLKYHYVPRLGSLMWNIADRDKGQKRAIAEQSQDDLAYAMQRCMELVAITTDGDPCETESVLFVGKDAQQAAEHNVEAIAKNPSLLRLHYRHQDKNPLKDEDWKNDEPACTPAVEGKDCDEYPFRATHENDRNAHLKLIDRKHNQREGSVFGTLVTTCGHDVADAVKEKKPLIVVSMPQNDAPNSFFVCDPAA